MRSPHRRGLRAFFDILYWGGSPPPGATTGEARRPADPEEQKKIWALAIEALDAGVPLNYRALSAWIGERLSKDEG